MVDRIVEEMFGCKVGICLLDNRPNALDSKRKKLADDGDTDELGGVDASIKEAGTRRSYLLRRHRELDKRMRENIRRDAEREVASYINELLNMADFYLDAIKWLRNTRPADAGNGDLTYFDIFLQSRPADEIWVV